MSETLREWYVLDDADIVVERDPSGIVHDGVECINGAADDGALGGGPVEILTHGDAHTLCVEQRRYDLEQPWLILSLDTFDEEARKDGGAIGV